MKTLKLKCDCVYPKYCDKLEILDIGDGWIEICNKKKGVTLNDKTVKKLIKFLQKI